MLVCRREGEGRGGLPPCPMHHASKAEGSSEGSAVPMATLALTPARMAVRVERAKRILMDGCLEYLRSEGVLDIDKEL